jgi:L-aspartate oxidase
MYTAVRTAESGARVVLVSRNRLWEAVQESASFWAQSALAAALAPVDSPERHARDTIAAGRGLCRTAAGEALVHEAPGAVEELVARGVGFDTRADGSLALALEGGHSVRRIVHAGGRATGRALTDRLIELVQASPDIDVRERTSVVALWSDHERCAGVITGHGLMAAPATVLATGGAALWARTTNPYGAIAAGSVLAHAAGAELADLEFCQFHPTALALPDSDHDGTLLTEALRGEGAMLLDAAGSRFTSELAPRDELTAAILDRMDADGSDHVGLDLRAINPARFPNVFAACHQAGLHPEREPVPVAPAAHYLIGGIVSDLHGRTTVPGLYASGSALAPACTARTASPPARSPNASCSEHAQPKPLPPSLVSAACRGSLQWRFAPPTAQTREAMWRLAGPRREAPELEQLLDDPYPLARLIARAALSRHESRAAHQRSDFPHRDPSLDGVHLVVDGDDRLRREDWR